VRNSAAQFLVVAQAHSHISEKSFNQKAAALLAQFDQHILIMMLHRRRTEQSL
jgi:hypothetical protein